MQWIKGVRYNLRGLQLGLRTPKLLFWGLVRFALVMLLTILAAALILTYHDQILGLVWQRPQSVWVMWLWYLVSWILGLFLIGVSAIIAFLVSQVLFSVLIMDLMSRITERIVTGKVQEPGERRMLAQLLFLIRQEFPRALLPGFISLLLMVLGWALPLGSVLIFLSSLMTAVFLAWDNTDLVPARQMRPCRERFRFLMKNLSFHLGFGLPFLIPFLNLLFLSFAPVGATLYHLERRAGRE